jgi:hypothetical protein
MREPPATPELIDAVSEFLQREVAPQLSGRLGFHLRVAVNVLAIVRRELTLGPAADGRESARLASLLGEDGALADLNETLTRRIAEGAFDADDAALVAHLWSTTLDTLAIDQPGYATFRRVAANDDAGAPALGPLPGPTKGGS